ncbi:MAG: hypothetical protein KDI19_13100 [Pseudomonadales bacterium]|nr:hypothetical protein [Pseudomonadales bacterium]
MAVIWQRRQGERRYEVRRAGRSIRLYTNGAFHSQYNPSRPFAGAVWDILTLPALYAERLPRSALMLGVGGGAVIRQLREVMPSLPVTGVELDPVHIEVARRFFGCTGDGIELVERDAAAWVKQSRRRFDLVIDDLYLDGVGDPERPCGLDDHFFNRLVRATAAGGVLVQNCLSPAIARETLARYRSMIVRDFASALLFTVDHYENGILALYRKQPGSIAEGTRRALRRTSESAVRLDTRRIHVVKLV